MAIDSLQGYDLVKPIPVLIEFLGDKVFVAEAPDLNLSIFPVDTQAYHW